MLCLKNMVGSEEVDEQLQEEIEEECSKYGDVENVIIYQVRGGRGLNKRPYVIIMSRKDSRRRKMRRSL